MQILGEGAFGRVYLGKMKNEDTYVAIKKIKKFDIIKSKQTDHIFNEIKILSILDHPFTIFIYGWTQDNSCIYIIMEFIIGGEVFSHLRSVSYFENMKAKLYAAQIVLIFE